MASPVRICVVGSSNVDLMFRTARLPHARSVIGIAVIAFALIVGGVAEAGDEPETKPHAPNPATSSVPFQFGSRNFRQFEEIIDAALSQDAKLLATASYKDVMVWDVETGRCLHHFPECGVPSIGRAINAGRVAFSSDARYLVQSVQYNFAARVWDLNSGREVGKCGTNPSANEYAFNSPWVQFAFASTDVRVFGHKRAQAFSANETGRGREISGEINLEEVLDSTSDARLIVCRGRLKNATANDRTETIVAEAATLKIVARLPVIAPTHAGFGLGGRILATMDNAKFRIWEVEGGKELASISRLQMQSADVRTNPAFSSDGKILYFGCSDGTIHRFDWQARQELSPFSKHLGCTTKIFPLADGKRVLSVGFDGAIRRWDVSTGKEIPLPDGYMGPVQRAVSPKTNFVALGDLNGRIDVWDRTGSTIVQTLRTAASPVGGLAFFPIDGTLASLHWDGRVRTWEPKSGRELKSFVVRAPFQGDGGPFQFGHAEFQLFARPGSQSMQAWDVRTGAPVWDFPIDAFRFALSPDGRTLAFSGHQNQHLISVSDPAAPNLGLCLRPSLRRPNENVECINLAFFADGRLASSHADGSVRIWDPTTYAETAIMRRDGGAIYRIYPSPDDRWLISRSPGEWVVWDTQTGTAVDSIPNLTERMRSNGADRADWPDQSAILPRNWLNQIRPPREANWPAGESAWKALGGADSVEAYHSLCGLWANPSQAVSLLRAHLHPVQGVPAERIAKLIAQLDSSKYTERETASRDLANLGSLARPALLESQQKGLSAEAGKRVQALLVALKRARTPDEQRIAETLQILEIVATPDACTLLTELSKGARGAFQTDEAQASLERLERASPPKK